MTADQAGERTAVVECVHCGTPGIVKFQGGGRWPGMTKILIACKCPRPSVKEANAMARKKASIK